MRVLQNVIGAVALVSLAACHAPFRSNQNTTETTLTVSDAAAETSLSGFAPEEATEHAVAFPAEVPAPGAAASCAPGIEIGCSTPQGTGTATCNSAGTAFGRCALLSCAPGLVLQGSICVPSNCTAGDSAPCADAHGSGAVACGESGTWSRCVMNACADGYHLVNGHCESETCDAGAFRSCGHDNGVGTQVCDGDQWGRCALTSCEPGFHLQLGRCVANSCTPGAVTGCRDPSGLGSGEQACNAIGSGFSACVLSACTSGYHLAGGVCVANPSCETGQSRVCTVPDGHGSQSCGTDGEWSACVASTCRAGFLPRANDGQCEPSTCKAGQTMGCQAPGGVGTGTMTCASSGTGYEACQLSGCPAGYTLAGGLCVTVGESPAALGAAAAAAPATLTDMGPMATAMAAAEAHIDCRFATLGEARPCVSTTGQSGLELCSIDGTSYRWSSCATGQ